MDDLLSRGEFWVVMVTLVYPVVFFTMWVTAKSMRNRHRQAVLRINAETGGPNLQKRLDVLEQLVANLAEDPQFADRRAAIDADLAQVAALKEIIGKGRAA